MYNLSDIKDFVSNLAVITTILQFLSGTLICKQYMKNRTTAESSALPFLCGFVSSGLWMLYGMIKHDNKVMFVNLVGISLMSMYIIVFYCYTYKKSSLLKQVFAMTFFMSFILGYVYVKTDNELLLSHIGIIYVKFQHFSIFWFKLQHTKILKTIFLVIASFLVHTSNNLQCLLACSLTLLTVGAPLSKLFYVMKVKCTECLPFPMIIMSFFVSALWFLYGLIEEDVYMTTPNFIGGALAVLQLSLFLIYPNKHISTPNSSKSVLA